MMLKTYKKNREHLRTKCIERDYLEGKLVVQQLKTAVLMGTIQSKVPVGLASNQIGLSSRVFIALIDKKWKGFINPIIEKHSKNIIECAEGCLSLDGKKTYKTKRYEWVTVSRLTDTGRVKKKYTGFTAIIIQHEIDHLNGKLCKDGGCV